MQRSVLRAIRASAIPGLVLGAALFGILYLAVLPAPGAKITLAGARAALRGQWMVPAIAVHATLVCAGVFTPFFRPGAAARSTRDALLAIPAIWLHVVAAQLLVVVGLVAGIVPGLVALAPAAVIGAAVATGARGRAAFDAAAAAVAPRRWRVVAGVLAIIAVEIGLTLALWKALTPPLSGKTPTAGLAAVYRFAWINTVRAAILVPILGAAWAVLFDRWRPPRGAAAT